MNLNIYNTHELLQDFDYCAGYSDLESLTHGHEALTNIFIIVVVIMSFNIYNINELLHGFLLWRSES